MPIPSLGSPSSSGFLDRLKEAVEILTGRRNNTSIDLGKVGGVAIKPYGIFDLVNVVNGWSSGIYFANAYSSFSDCVDSLTAEGADGALIIITDEQVINDDVDASAFTVWVIGGSFVSGASVEVTFGKLLLTDADAFTSFTGTIEVGDGACIGLGTVVTNGSSDSTFTVVSGHSFAFTAPSAGQKFDPSGTFPDGHSVKVINLSATSSMAFDSTGINTTVAAGKTREFVYASSAWHLEDRT